MGIKENDLDSDLKVFEQEDGSVDDSVNADSLDHYLHQSQEDSFSGESSSRVKKFFDYINLHVFLPWLSALTKGFNALKKAVEEEYLKSERVQQKYDPESADPLSGKAVAEAAAKVMELTDADTIWEGISMTGGYLEASGDQFWHISLAVEIARLVSHNGSLDGEFTEGNTDGWAFKVRIFVKNTESDLLYFISCEEVLKAAQGKFEPMPIFKPGGGGDATLDALFPDYTQRVKVDHTQYMDIPSEDAKFIIETEEPLSYLYLWNPETYDEPSVYFREGASSPYILPDDLVGQGGTMWKEGCQIEPIWGEANVYLVSSKEQTDKTAISPTRLKELIEAATVQKTIYIPVARFSDSFALTEEMKENGLVIRRNSPANDYVSGGFSIYDPNGNIDSEPTVSAPAEAGGVVPFDVSGYEVGSQFMFYGGSDGQYGGNLEVQMPFTMKTVSSEKLAALIAEEVSEE